MVAIAYGRHILSGANRAPDEVQDGVGRNANVACLGCGERLQHVRRAPTYYYRHDVDSNADADSCAETALHAMAKDIVAGLRGVIKLPSWCGLHIEFDADSGATEVDVSGRRKPIADAALWNERGQPVAVEVKVAHGKDAEDAESYRAARGNGWSIAMNPNDSRDTIIKPPKSAPAALSHIRAHPLKYTA